VKVRIDRPGFARLPWRASVTALVTACIASLGLLPATAHAITRTDVLDRAHTWVVKKVHYSQRATFGGYRRDCSGFVSMAWKLGHSYDSRTIRSVASRIPLSKLQPGDAVRTPGHVAIFVRWANKKRSRYVAMEETTWGHPATRRVRSLGHGASGLRYHGLTDEVVLVAAAPDPGISPMATASLLGAGTPAAFTRETTAASVITTQAAAASAAL
jgi:hypothetical protein